jgi:universal stress protein A
MKQIRRILYATDFSPASRRAFDAAVLMAKSFKARLTIASVVMPVAALPEAYIDGMMVEGLDRQARRWSAGQLERLATRAKKAGVNVAVVLRHGDPAEEIVRASRGMKADLIVVGTHGRRGLPKFVLGSVAQRVVSTASCPVLTVRGT